MASIYLVCAGDLPGACQQSPGSLERAAGGCRGSIGLPVSGSTSSTPAANPGTFGGAGGCDGSAGADGTGTTAESCCSGCAGGGLAGKAVEGLRNKALRTAMDIGSKQLATEDGFPILVAAIEKMVRPLRKDSLLGVMIG